MKAILTPVKYSMEEISKDLAHGCGIALIVHYDFFQVTEEEEKEEGKGKKRKIKREKEGRKKRKED